MKVVLAGSALPGIRAAQTTRIAATAWEQMRPSDEIASWVVSDGISMPLVGSGLDDVLATAQSRVEERGSVDTRHFALRTGNDVLLDYTTLLAGVPAEGSPSSALVGHDLLWAVDSGVTHAILALPVPGSIDDMGYGLLASLARMQTHLLGSHSSQESELPAVPELATALAQAKERLGGLRITLLAPSEQRLLGLSGVARSWMQRGIEPAVAQAAERRIGELASRVIEASAHTRRTSLLADELTSRGIYAGIGGGLGFMFEALGASIFPVGDLTVRDRLTPDISNADLVVYISGAINDDLPSGLISALDQAKKVGVPVVVVYDSGALRKGELPSLGLNGAYELRPDFAFEPPEAIDEFGRLQPILFDMMTRVARTWGWD
ncbi:glycerate kinase [Changpingibacter yushuensis]|uniref:glycerate kinase n=1 Tax=Changpingibacter yushuensis TaxID=2758440 RepID=UPI0015F4920A|nr:glycerate kinase [Changpingibacter yushuensis]